MKQIFNVSYALEQVLAPLSQEDIWNTPEYFAMSRDQIRDDPKCPEHLRRVLDQLPLGIRPNYIQVRPQDFRRGLPEILGRAWHLDLNTNLDNGRAHIAKGLDEFRSSVVSFGDVVETEFVKGPLMIDTSKVDPFDHCAFASFVDRLHPETVVLAPNQIASYTSRDIHRVGSKIRLGKMRLIIVTVECDTHIEKGGGNRRPSIRERFG